MGWSVVYVSSNTFIKLTSIRLAAVGVLISTLENPQSFNNFSQVNTFAQENGEGIFCFPLDFTTANVTSLGLKSGDNVTIQVSTPLVCTDEQIMIH